MRLAPAGAWIFSRLMRFLMLNWRDPQNPISGGAERVSVAYMRALVGRGHYVAWFANAFPGCKPTETIDGIQYIHGGGKGTSILKARAWYRTQPRFDLVIDQHHGLPWYAPWWCGTRSIAYIHEVLGPVWDSFYPWPLSSIGRMQERWTHRLYAKIPFWTVSESTRQQLLADGVRQVTVIPNGTDIRAVASLEPKPFGTPVRLIAVSRLAPNKRVDHAIRAVQLLNESGIETHLTVVGSGDDAVKLKAQAAATGLGERIQFSGHIAEEEKNRLMAQAHLLIHTSVREGWGLNVIEANCMGTPAVVYPVGGLVDSTVKNVTGLVTDRETPESAAAAIRSLAENPARYDGLRQAAWGRSKTFHWDHVLRAGSEFLEMAAKGELPKT